MAMRMVEAIAARVGAYVEKHTLIAPDDMVVVAVSGGADSLCLLYVLHRLAPERGWRLHVAHLDHALRPGSPDDARYVAAQATTLGLPCSVARRDVRALARERGLSMETAAREARYAFLREVAAASGAAEIATGHTRDDQAETLLLHLARGSGLNGLAGMRPRRGNLVRPLLESGRAETEACCAELGLAPREDESNRSDVHARNRLRHAVLPLLAEVYPSASANVARTARLLAADLDLIERLAGRALDRAVTSLNEGRATVSVARWAEAEPELRPHMLRLLLVRLRGHATGFDERAYETTLRALAPGAPDTMLSLPKGLALVRRGDSATLGPPMPPAVPLGTYVLPVPGGVATEAGVLVAELARAPMEWKGVPTNVAYLDPVACGEALHVRAWRAGDRVRPLGLGGTRKVQDVFTDRKVPPAARSRVPIVEGTRGIAWIAGILVAEPYRVAPYATAVRVTWDAPHGVRNAVHYTIESG